MLLDTTILIDLLRGNTATADFVDTAFADDIPLLAIPDALIAATALAQELELASDNVRHFEMVSGLRVARPY
jgi:predicted nucleic acid-binding protein